MSGFGEGGMGRCPTFTIDVDRCCLSLNIFPGLLSAFFLLTAIGCNAIWGLTWLVVGPVLFAGVLVVMMRDGERCLLVSLVFQGIVIVLVLYIVVRRHLRKSAAQSTTRADAAATRADEVGSAATAERSAPRADCAPTPTECAAWTGGAATWRQPAETWRQPAEPAGAATWQPDVVGPLPPPGCAMGGVGAFGGGCCLPPPGYTHAFAPPAYTARDHAMPAPGAFGPPMQGYPGGYPGAAGCYTDRGCYGGGYGAQGFGAPGGGGCGQPPPNTFRGGLPPSCVAQNQMHTPPLPPPLGMHGMADSPGGAAGAAVANSHRPGPGLDGGAPDDPASAAACRDSASAEASNSDHLWPKGMERPSTWQGASPHSGRAATATDEGYEPYVPYEPDVSHSAEEGLKQRV